MLVEMSGSGDRPKVRPTVEDDHPLEGATAQNRATAYGG